MSRILQTATKQVSGWRGTRVDYRDAGHFRGLGGSDGMVIMVTTLHVSVVPHVFTYVRLMKWCTFAMVSCGQFTAHPTDLNQTELKTSLSGTLKLTISYTSIRSK